MSAPQPASVTLRTGAEVPEAVVGTVTIVLGRLMDTDPIALYEAVMVARDETHVPFGQARDVLRGYHLIDGYGRMHGATRDVILAATEGEEFDRHLVSPYASDSATEAQR